ncbi:MAG: phosphoribosylglycinamide formyltransferase [Gemmatimonadetes bacterium GWC2_71_10]|nr:MAG: phosphoribosylglycinamide formyltransferase [Gemmatimonadetes bacterium GWC2_71_10]
MLPIAVLASGGGTNLQALLDDLDQPDAPGRIALVISHRTDAGALSRARRAAVPTYVVPQNGQDTAGLLAALESHGIRLVVLAGYLKLVPPAVVRAFTGRMLNIHPALLPAFGGAGMYGRRVHEAVLAAGARLTGPTVHLVDEHYDRGTIVAQWPVPVKAGDTPDTLAARVLAAEHRLLVAVVRRACRRLAADEPIVPFDLDAEHFAPSPTPFPECDHALVTS